MLPAHLVPQAFLHTADSHSVAEKTSQYILQATAEQKTNQISPLRTLVKPSTGWYPAKQSYKVLLRLDEIASSYLEMGFAMTVIVSVQTEMKIVITTITGKFPAYEMHCQRM